MLKPTRLKTAALVVAALGGTLLSGSAWANSAAVDYFRGRADRSAVPSLLSHDDRDYYTRFFEAIDRKDWTTVQQLIAERKGGLLQQAARGEYYLAAGSPKIDLPDLSEWLQEGTDLPDADRIASLAMKRGLATMPSLPTEQTFQHLDATPRRVRPSSIDDGTMPAQIASGILDRIKNDDPMGAQVLLDGISATLSPAAYAEWGQRVA